MSGTSPRRRAVVVGAGMGGLAGAIDLAADGWEVDLFEAAPDVGGKMRQVGSGASRIDAGPTVLTLRGVFEQLFAKAGRTLDAQVTLEPMGILARHQWPDGSRLDLFADPAESRRAIEAFAGRTEADGFVRFLDHARSIWETVEGPFVHSQRPTPGGILRDHGLAALSMLMKIDSRRTMWKALGSFFRDPRLVQLFGRYATYTGCSPFLAPATLNLVAWVEAEGVWRVQGGMHALARAMVGVLTSLGGRVHLSTPVSGIHVTGRRATGVVLRGGDVVTADAVLFAGDVSALGTGLLGRDAASAVDAVPRRDRSLSAVTWCLDAETRGFPLAHHNIFFGGSSKAEFGALLEEWRLPSDPTVYVCAQDRDDRATASGPERLLVLVNAPAVGDDEAPGAEELERCQQDTFARLQQSGLTWSPTGTPVRTAPTDFHRLFPGSGGALYGAATHGWTASLKRPSARTRLRGLYLAGGTAHPGAGVPMAATSGRLAARAIGEDLASTSP